MYFFFFFNDTATTEIYTLSLHDALPISGLGRRRDPGGVPARARLGPRQRHARLALGDLRDPLLLLRVGAGLQNKEWIDRKSTRLNSSHGYISYAVFCLKKKKKKQ